MSSVSWADLHDNVPIHRDRDDFRLWETCLRQYCYGKGVLAHLDVIIPEPFRRNKLPAWGKVVAVLEPVGDQIEEKLFHALRAKHAQALHISVNEFIADGRVVTLTHEELAVWDRWAEKERLARMAILRSLSPELQRDPDLLAQPTARHLYRMIVNRHEESIGV
ncbi:uncharacterized protein LOC62_03G003754 [Vanrija pseudolonga]|uniref:Uncharacterized protein n=1 Tax=Vanrija pseudolonga TaxID=143232 RepID=A0AAF0YAW3_9TREE|nr:hypothetical protein LOC62_03G003754 [Vanrija pseudolonga]